jgi:hypothetical protein
LEPCMQNDVASCIFSRPSKSDVGSHRPRAIALCALWQALDNEKRRGWGYTAGKACVGFHFGGEHAGDPGSIWDSLS